MTNTKPNLCANYWLTHSRPLSKLEGKNVFQYSKQFIWSNLIFFKFFKVNILFKKKKFNVLNLLIQYNLIWIPM